MITWPEPATLDSMVSDAAGISKARPTSVPEAPMSHLWSALRTRARSDVGTSAVEYGLLVVSIAAVIAAIVFSVGLKVKAAFDDTCAAYGTAQGQQPARPGAQPTGCD